MKKDIPKSDSLWQIAAQNLGDPTKFRDIAELNGIGNILNKIDTNKTINIPETNDYIKKAEPILGDIAKSTRGYSKQISALTGEVSNKIQTYSKYLPPEFKRYSDVAVKYLGEVNGVVGKVETELEGKLKGVTDQLRKYGGQSTRLVDWLLVGSDKIGVGNVSQILGKFLGKK